MPEHDEFDERLTQRLRAYESRIPDGEIPMTQTQSTNRSRSSLAAGAVIAMGALAGVVLALVLLNRPTADIGDSSPSPSASVQATESTEPSIAPSQSAAPSASAPAFSAPTEGYTTIVLGDSGSATVATSGPGGAVVLGYDGNGPIGWHSTDGRDWVALTLPSDGSTDLRPMAVVASDLGYVAAMANCVTECGGGVLWYSPDGLNWTLAPLAISGGVLVHLAAGGPGFVAIAIEPLASGSPGVTPTVLVSETGQSWESGQPSDLLESNIHALASMGNVIVAVGTAGNPEGGALDASWTTSDGVNWERFDEDSDRAAVFDLAWNGEQLLAVGQGSCPGGVGLGLQCPGEANIAWQSADGRTWQPALADPCCSGLSSVAATATGWVATVTPGEPPDPAPPALAGQVGEAEWRAVEIDAGGELFLQSVATHDGLTLFVGEVRQGDTPQPVVIVFDAQLP